MGVPVFEDAVPALGAELHGRKLGTFGLAGAFSTQSDKSLNCGEGGFLITDDSELFARATVLSGAYEGRLRRHFPDGEPPISTDLDLPLLSFRMDEIRAALLRAELVRLPIRLKLLPQQLRLRRGGAGRRRRHRDPAAGRAGRVPRRGVHLPGARTAGPDAKWFAHALCCEGIDARNLGSDDDTNVRVFWNWRFLFDTAGRGRDPGDAAGHHPLPVRGGRHPAVLDALGRRLRPPDRGGPPGRRRHRRAAVLAWPS